MRSLACGFTHEPDRTEQAVVVHRGGLHLRFDPAPTRDDVGYLLVVATGSSRLFSELATRTVTVLSPRRTSSVMSTTGDEVSKPLAVTQLGRTS